MLCPAAEDAALCEEYVRGYWSEITPRCTLSSWTPRTSAKGWAPAPRTSGPSLPLTLVTSAVDPSPGSLRSSAPPSRMPRSSPSCRVTGAQELKTLRPVNRVSPIRSRPPCPSSVRFWWRGTPNTAASSLLTESAARWIRTDLELNHRIIAHQPIVTIDLECLCLL